MAKKILIISQNFYPEIGSAGNRMKNMYLMLKSEGLDVDILTTDPTYPVRGIYENHLFWNHPELNEDDTAIKRVSVKKKNYSRSIWNRLFYYLEFTFRMVFHILRSKEKYDLIIATSPPIFMGIVGWIGKHRFKSKLILDIRDLWPESLKGVGVFNYPPIIYLFQKIEKILYRSADKIVVNSKGFNEYITAVSEDFEKKLVYIPNGAREEELKQEACPDSENFKVVYAGNIGLAQNDKLLLELAGVLHKRDIEMTIIGYGLKRKELLKEIKAAGLTNVTVIKPQTREDCFEIIAAHHVGIVTLVDSDVFKTVLPGKIIDYMTCGVPIVASVSGFSKETIDKEQTGLIAENESVEEMAAHIDYLRDHPDKRQQLGANGRKYVKRNFMWETNISKLIRIINSETTEHRSLTKAGS